MNIDTQNHSNYKLSPLEYSLSEGLKHSKSTEILYKKKRGQFFTSKEIAVYMASLATCLENKETISILDPGAGFGSLSCAIIERVINEFADIKKINLCVYEIDANIIFKLEEVLNNLKEFCIQRNVVLKYEIENSNFLLTSSLIANNEKNKYDLVISNPPYFKLSKKDKVVITNQQLSLRHTNIYSLFLDISSCLIKKKGELIFIVPRSFSSGKYFKNFRNYFFSKVSLKLIHSFDSRSNAFKADNVLQETIILRCSLKEETNAKVIISSSSGVNDLAKSQVIFCSEKNIIDFNSKDKSLFIPKSKDDLLLLKDFSKLPFKLINLGLKASTGPIVFFRNLDYLSPKKSKQSVPLFWLNNVFSMRINWPNKEFERPQYFSKKDLRCKQLIEIQNYVLIRRFSAKGDKRRLVASPLIMTKRNLLEYSHIGIENKLNYIHKLDSNFTESEAVGLSAILSSKLYNDYFIMLNGNTNVSVTELNQIPFPSLKSIALIGQNLINNGISDELINKEIYSIFK